MSIWRHRNSGNSLEKGVDRNEAKCLFCYKIDTCISFPFLVLKNGKWYSKNKLKVKVVNELT